MPQKGLIMINFYSENTKIGKITIFEEDGSIIRVVLPILSMSTNGCQRVKTPAIAEAFKQLTEFLDRKRTDFNLKLAPKGTPFQKRVWAELLKIPYGKTVSYQDIAVAIGNPKACRAVGMANNKNPIPIFIPCHRVIGKNGKMIGYAGGLDCKKSLLDIEQVIL